MEFFNATNTRNGAIPKPLLAAKMFGAHALWEAAGDADTGERQVWLGRRLEF